MGQLVPVAWFEALPGDTIQMATSCLVRCAPLVTPPMHPVHVRLHHWFVPNRLLWSNWANFITGGADGLNNSGAPYIQFGNATVSSLADHLGVPTAGMTAGTPISALPFRAYAMIWNEFYRDEDLQSPLAIGLGDSNDATTNVTLANVAWEKDYLTSSRPWAYKGATVTLPLGTSAPVKAPANTQISVTDNAANPRNLTGTNASANVNLNTAAAASGALFWNPSTGLYADLSTATAVDINTVRHAFALQRFEEARARYGSRYVEYLRYLGVRSSDARLQRPEYLGGGRQTLQFSEVLQTGVTTSGTAGGVGSMYGHGITAMRSNRYRRFFEEHGIVMTLMSVRPRTMYSQRVKRAFIRGIVGFAGTTGTKEDYWQRELQHIGQQQVNGLEVDAQVGGGNGFGWQDRYDEYRREESGVAGSFRNTLNIWHLARDFGSAPVLNSTFISCVPSTRIFADTANDNLYVMANHSIQARRLLAREGTSATF